MELERLLKKLEGCYIECRLNYYTYVWGLVERVDPHIEFNKLSKSEANIWFYWAFYSNRQLKFHTFETIRNLEEIKIVEKSEILEKINERLK